VPHQVEHGRPAGVVGTRDDVHPRRGLTVDEESLAGRFRTALDQLQLEKTGRSDDFLGAVDVGHAGQLDQDLVAVRPLLGDARLGNAQLVDPALDRFTGLDNRLFTQRHLDRAPHRERVGAVHPRGALEVGLDFRRGLAER
jgi:hypothetical protein